MKTLTFQHRKWYAVVLFMLILSITNALGAVTFTANTDKGSTQNTSADSMTKDGITISSTSAGLAYTQYRFYSGTITISSTVGNITSVVFTATSEAYGNVLRGGTASTGSMSGSSTTATWTGNNSSFTLKITAQSRVSKIVVTTSSGCTGTKLGTPVVTATASDRQVVLSWSAVSNASSYQLKWNGGEWATATSPVTKTGLTNGTAYTYQVKAIGNGSTYCDGDASEEASATPNVYYTVTWMNNGSEYTTTSVVSGQRPTFPDAPTSCDDESTTFYGWTTSTWSGKIDDISAKTIYTSASAMPTVTSNGTIYHAVFCKGNSTTWEITEIDQLSSSSGYAGYNGTHTANGMSYLSYQVMEQSSLIQFQSSAGYIYNSVAFASPISKIEIESTSTNWSVYSSAASISSTPASGAISISTSGNKHTFNVSASNHKYFHIKGGASTPKASSIKVYYGTSSKYLTNCCTALGQINGPINLTNYKHLYFSIITLNIMLLQMNKHVKYRFYPLFTCRIAGTII